VPEAAFAATASTVDIRTAQVLPYRVDADEAGYRAVAGQQLATLLAISPVFTATDRQVTADECTTAHGASRRTVLAGVVGAAGLAGVATVLGTRFSGRPSRKPRRAAPVDASPTPASPDPIRTSAATAPETPDRARAVAEVEAQVADQLAGTGKYAAVAVVDRVTGVALTVNGTTRFRTASIVKVDILAALLLRHQRSGTTLTRSQHDLARSMITSSDNAAASSLWIQIDAAAGLSAANRAFGMTDTTPGANGAWGATATTAADQRRLLQAVTDQAGPLSAGHREYLLDLMGRVIDSQDWGVPSAATPQATACQVKNGWMPFTAQDGQWTVNSIGRIVEPGHDWLAAVLSDRNASQGAGIATVEAAVRLAINGLRSATG
jgi:beta-lactamase class A